MQKVGYAYDFTTGKILDNLTLSIALKQLSCLSESFKATGDLTQKYATLVKIKGMLISQTTQKFQDAFENKDKHALT